MEVGTRYLLDTSALGNSCSPPFTSLSPSIPFSRTKVTGVITGKRSHLEDSKRVLFFFHATSVEIPVEYRRLWLKGGGSSGGTTSSPERMDKHFTNELIPRGNYFISSDGYKYQYDGWYDEDFFLPLSFSFEDQESDLFPKDCTALKSTTTIHIPQSWIEAMDQQPSLCEVRYLCYSFQPWFYSPYERFSYLSLPDSQCCYSLYICHRCLTPFFSLVHLATHLEGYCEGSRPPGELIYHDKKTESKVYYVDGARHLHYGRCASMLGKFFIESQVLLHDVDLYEFFIVTIPTAQLPYFGPEESDRNSLKLGGIVMEDKTDTLAYSLHDSFLEAAAQFDKGEKKWFGDVVVGYFSRLKHQRSHALSCIVVLPPFQRMGIGKFLLNVAYYLTHVRQTTCGCLLCGQDGGAVARPFSPHGQHLLLSYWGEALRKAVMKCCKKAFVTEVAEKDELKKEKDVNNGLCSSACPATACFQGPLCTFTSLRHLQESIDIPIHMDDLEFLLVHDSCTFYNTRENCNKGTSDESCSSFTSFPLVATLAFEEKDLHSLSISAAAKNPDSESEVGLLSHGRIVFHKDWFLRDATGQLLYRKDCFHY